MSDPYVGEIRMFGGNFAPNGWLFCQGQLVAISDYDTLFNLIGTTYGGDGQNTFALPNLASRIPVHMGSAPFGTYVLGQPGGAESVTLLSQQLPVHTHTAQASSGSAGQTTAGGNYWATPTYQAYSTSAPNVPMAPQALAPAGGNQPHDNMSPYLAINFIISMYGIYPSPS
ncbi:MAG: tail fiber protein [Actinomycetota bacterium]|nr:tail fiber protein [Actinomycetota bacterium]MDQ2956679.1 tail fiber protein [Actinomycetota bacterium]